MNLVAPTYSPYLVSGGVSAEADWLLQRAAEPRRQIEESLYLGWRRALAEDAYAVARECSAPDWDGYGAQPIQPEALLAALRFIELLPEGIAKPEVTPEPSGSLAFDWNKGKGRIFSVTLEPHAAIYAGIIGGNDFRGKILFWNELPASFLQPLHEYFRA